MVFKKLGKNVPLFAEADIIRSENRWKARIEPLKAIARYRKGFLVLF